MTNNFKYRPTDKLSDLVSDNFMLLMVVSRFGLSLGFGEKSVREACESQDVDCATFLAVANFISSGESDYGVDNLPELSVEQLMSYLKNAHTYFLDFSLPLMRRKLIEAIDFSTGNNVAMLMIKFFDDVVKEVRAHMEYENRHVFTYVDRLLRGRADSRYSIGRFTRHHTQIDEKLRELKNIIIKYYPERGDNNLLNAVLFDIFNCEQDLASHRQVEDCLFAPAVALLEEKLKK